MAPEITSPLSFRSEGCPYLDTKDLELRFNLENMPGYEELAQDVRDPIIRALGLSDEAIQSIDLNQL